MEKERTNSNNEFWNDARFLKDMLSADEKSSRYWEVYIEQHPEKREMYEKALSDLRKLKLNNYSLSADKKDALLKRIHCNYTKQQSRKRGFYTTTLVLAACFLGLLYFLPIYNQLSNSSPSVKALTGVLPVDSSQTEVTLITGNSGPIKLADNVVIECDSNIYLQATPEDKNGVKKLVSASSEKSTMNTLVVPRGRRSSLILADGSKVWVNAGSILHFPSSFDPDKRMIQVEGEIYIEVAKEISRPFYVQTSNFMINVLGTKFNVFAYPDEVFQSVVLVEGSVTVNTKEEKDIKLVPNQKLTMSKEQNMIDNVDVCDYTSWKDGMLQFHGESVHEILRRISRYYNVQIMCDPSIADRKCGGKLMLFDDVQQVLGTFSMLYDVNCRFESDTIYIE